MASKPVLLNKKLITSVVLRGGEDGAVAVLAG
jgi:hypothetical protein